MTAEVRALRDVDETLRRDLLAMWTVVTNAGGAVGFVPPVTQDDVAPTLDDLVRRVREGRALIVLLTVDGRVGGFAALLRASSPLRRHWATVLRVQVHPSLQGRGLGRVLMAGVHEVARADGLEFLHLGARDGAGVEGFYRRLGYQVVGRLPGAIRVAPGDDRDEIQLVRRLGPAVRPGGGSGRS